MKDCNFLPIFFNNLIQPWKMTVRFTFKFVVITFNDNISFVLPCVKFEVEILAVGFKWKNKTDPLSDVILWL